LSELAELERKVREFVNKVSADFGVSPPKVRFARPAFADVAGWYDEYGKEIVLNSEYINLESALHEFAHHLQNLRGVLARVSREEFGKVHCERGFEREAKGFAAVYQDFYRDTWKKIVGVERGALPR
jgi:hypothetical protein